MFQSGNAVASAQTDSSGDYDFLIVQPGTFDVSAVAPEGTFNVATGVVVATGASVTQNFQAGNSTLTVTVTDGIQSVTGDTVTLDCSAEGSSQSVAQATVGTNGTATFSGLVAGNYTVTSYSASGDAGQAPVTVPANGSASASVVLTTQASLSGTITDGNGNPISGATVVAQLSSNLQQTYLATTASDGTYSLAGLPPGVYDITIFADQYAAITQASVSVQTTATVNAALTASTTTINGTLVDTAGNPVSTGSVGVYDASGHLIGAAQVNANGSFSISSASGNNLTLQAYATGYAIPAALMINAPVGVNTQLSAIVLQQVAIDPNATWTTSPPASPSLPMARRTRIWFGISPTKSSSR